MENDELAERLDTVVRRQRYILWLVAYPYLVWGLWVATGSREPFLAVVPALVIGVLKYLLALYRARFAGEGSGGDGSGGGGVEGGGSGVGDEAGGGAGG